jgi:hypothetical protein
MYFMDTITTPILDSSTNLLFASQKETPDNASRIHPVMTSSALPKMLNMPESDWTFATAGDRPIALGQGSWTTLQPIGTTITSYAIPNATYSLSHFFVNMLKFMSYFRCDIRIRFQLNSNRFNQGLLLAYFVPLRSRQIVSGAVNGPGSTHLFNTTLLPHAFLDASQSTDANLIIPWSHICTFFPLNANPSGDFATLESYLLGTVYVDVLVPLSTAAAAAPIVNYYVYFEPINTRVHVPTVPRNFISQGLEGVFAGTMATARSIFSAVSNVMSYNFAGAVSDAVGVVDGVKVVLDNLDKPLDPVKGRRVLTIAQSYASLDGIDGSVRLSAGAASTTYHPEEVVGDANAEMYISNLVRLHTIIDISAWTTNDAVGTLLETYYVHPFIWTITSVGDDNYLFDASNIAALVGRFCFWRGSIKFIIKIVNTVFHTGRLRIVFVPNTTIAPSSFADTASYPQMIFDIREEKEIVFTVPFISDKPWKRSYNSVYEVGDAPSFLEEMLGSIHIYVQTILSAPATVNNAVAIVVMVAGGDDFEVSTLGSYPVSGVEIAKAFSPIGSGALAALEPQGDEVPTSDQQDRDDVVTDVAVNELITTDRRIGSFGTLMNGENITSLKQVFKRFEVFMYEGNAVNLDGGNIAFYISVNPLLDAYTVNNSNLVNTDFVFTTHLSWFSSMYAFWRGSLRYKFMINFNSPTLAGYHYVFHDPGFYVERLGFNGPALNSGVGNFAAAFESTNIMPCLQVEVPFCTDNITNATQFYSPSNSDVVIAQVCSTGGLTYVTMGQNSTVAAKNVYPLVSMAGGDDYLCHWYIGPTTMQLNIPTLISKGARTSVSRVFWSKSTRPHIK